ncbi:MAG: hypothetical protein ACK4GR_04335, partial [bacterium]
MNRQKPIVIIKIINEKTLAILEDSGYSKNVPIEVRLMEKIDISIVAMEVQRMDEASLMHLAESQIAKPEVLRQVWVYHKENKGLMYALAGNWNTPADLLAEMAEDEDLQPALAT